MISNIFCWFGFPENIVSDRDVRFNNQINETIIRKCKIRLNRSSINHPESDRQTEITNKKLIRMLKKYSFNQTEKWCSCLAMVQLSYNNTIHSAIATTPFFAVYGYHTNIPLLEESIVAMEGDSHSGIIYMNLQKSVLLRTQDEMLYNQSLYEEQSNKHCK